MIVRRLHHGWPRSPKLHASCAAPSALKRCSAWSKIVKIEPSDWRTASSLLAVPVSVASGVASTPSAPALSVRRLIALSTV